MGKVIRIYFIGTCHYCGKAPRGAMERAILFFSPLMIGGVQQTIGWGHEECVAEAAAETAEHLLLLAPKIEAVLGLKKDVIRKRILLLRRRLRAGRADHKSVLIVLRKLVSRLAFSDPRSAQARLAGRCMDGLKHLARERFLSEIEPPRRRLQAVTAS